MVEKLGPRFRCRVDLLHLALFVWLFIGNLVFWNGDIPIYNRPPNLVVNLWQAMGYAALGLLSAAFALIYKNNGRGRFIGLWLRLGADLMQFAILAIFMYGLLSGDFENCPGQTFVDIMAIGVGTISNFLVVLILQDVIEIIRTERLAKVIRRKW